ncbi:hypothetical protein ES703_21022 [subsurface metagenome]
MSRLKYAFHMRFNDIEAYKIAIANTPFKNFEGWEQICQGNRIATQGVLFWLWMVWSYQREEIGRVNWLYVEWRFRDFKFPWPYGTIRIPVAVLGKAKPNWATLNINYKNAIT